MRNMPLDPIPTLVAIRPRPHRIPTRARARARRLVREIPRHDQMRHGVLPRRGRRGRIDGRRRGRVEMRCDGGRRQSRLVRGVVLVLHRVERR